LAVCVCLIVFFMLFCSVFIVFCFFFFFFSSRRRHTRSYGDWSSDVCSSDLRQLPDQDIRSSRNMVQLVGFESLSVNPSSVDAPRSEERRVGKECRSRWSPDH